MAYSPFMDTVTLTTNGTTYNLATLLAAIDKNLSSRLQYLRLEFDILGAGNVYIGNSNVSSAHCGSHLIPSQEKNMFVWDSGLLLSGDIYMVADTDAQKINVTAIPAGA